MKLSRIYSQMSTDELFDTYTDNHTEWDVICEEVERRTPIPFQFVGFKPELEIDEETIQVYWYPTYVNITYDEAIGNLKAKHKIKVRLEHGKELPYDPNCFLNSYWDEEKKKLISLPPIKEEDELPF